MKSIEKTSLEELTKKLVASVAEFCAKMDEVQNMCRDE
jgi:hypothetical protein